MTRLRFYDKVLALNERLVNPETKPLIEPGQPNVLRTSERMIVLENASNKTLWTTVKEGFRSFADTVKSGPDYLYFILVICYVVSEYAERIYWTNDLFPVKQINIFDYLVLFGSGAYLCYKAAMWKKMREKPLLLLPVILAVGLLSCLFLLYLDKDWNHRKVTYTIVIDIFLCLMAYGKDYKKLLRYIVFVPIATLVIAGLGLLVGLTQEFTKMGQADSTRSLGIIYPNTWGYIAFQALLLLWYLYLKKKPLLTFPLFWITGVFMYFVIGCRTIAVLSMAFPPVSVLMEWMEKRERKPGKKPGLIAWIAIALPVLCYAVSIGLSLEKEWVAMTFYPSKLHPDAPLHSTAMRFVQGGLALDVFGFPLFGRPMTLPHIYTAKLANDVTRTFVNVGDSIVYLDLLDPVTGSVIEHLYVMDNAYVSFTITKGILWIACALAWLTFAQWKGWKNKDYSILLIGSFMLVFAVMECPGMEVWYNFVLLYPLASYAKSIAEKTVSPDQAI